MMGNARKGNCKKSAERPTTIRAFISIPIPDHVAYTLQKIRKEFQASGLHARWVVPENIHLTVKFLGETDADRIPSVAKRMDAAAGTLPPFSIYIQGGGVFPTLHRARVLWVGLSGDINALRAIHSAVDEELRSVGFKKENRRFHPHLTIGRAKKQLNTTALKKALDSVQEIVSEPFVVNRLYLYKSLLMTTGAKYTKLHTAHLGFAQ